MAKDRRERVEGRVDRLIACMIPALAGETALFADKPVDTSPLIASLTTKSTTIGVARTDRFQAPIWIQESIGLACRGPTPACDVADALADLLPALHWYQRSEPQLPDFMSGHANTIVIGPRGVDSREDAIVGVTVMAPNLEYPDHRHPPQELYIALSDGEWRQNDSQWCKPGLGGPRLQPVERAAWHASRIETAGGDLVSMELIDFHFHFLVAAPA